MPPSYITRDELSSLILLPHSSLAIIDVRDDDHVGGHIHKSTHVPSSSLDYKIPELVRKLMETEIVVFHCALSQQRGPTAAERYVRAREKRLVEKDSMSGAEGKGGGSNGVEQEGGLKNGELEGGRPEQVQVIYVLDGGFVHWQEKYGRDPRLTDAFAPDIWIDYY